MISGKKKNIFQPARQNVRLLLKLFAALGILLLVLTPMLPMLPITSASAAGTATHLTAGGSSTNGSSYTTASISPSANCLVLAWVSNSTSGTLGTPTLSGNGLTWVSVASQSWDSVATPTKKTTLFRAMKAAPTSGAVTINFAGVTQSGAAWSIQQFCGVDTSGTDGSGAILNPTPGVDNGAPGGLSITLPALSDANNITAGGFANEATSATDISAGTGYTPFTGATYNVPSLSTRAEWKTPGSSTVNVTQATANRIAGIAVEIKYAYPPKNVYYSVGQNTTDHKTGTPTVTISGGTATFSTTQTATNMGVGDKVTYNGSTVAYISGKISTSQWTLVTATGGTPADVTNQTVNSIAHAYASLSAAEAGASDASHLNTADLVAGNYILNIPCYYDSGSDTTPVTVDGWTTGANNYIKIYTPKDTSTEVNQSQRHAGVWNTTGAYSLVVTGNNGININASNYNRHVRIDGLQVYVSSVTADSQAALYYSTTSPVGAGSVEFVTSNNILRGVSTTYTWHDGVSTDVSGVLTGTHKIYNNIVYGFKGNANNEGIVVCAGTINAYVYNNTLYDNYNGLEMYSTPAAAIAKNNLISNSTNQAAIGTWLNGTDYNATNGSSMGYTVTGGGNTHDRLSQTLTFVSAGTDFHLASTDAGAKDYGVNLSADPYLAFSTDVDGNTRPEGSAWDIGADEYRGTTIGDGTSPANRNVGHSTTNRAVDAFTLSTTSGSNDTLTGLTVTLSGTGAAADIAASGVKIWKDDGTTANEWDAGDTQIGSGVSMSGTTATFTGLTETITASSTQYLITYDISATATVGATLLGRVSAATVSKTLVNNDTTDNTLTVAAVSGTLYSDEGITPLAGKSVKIVRAGTGGNSDTTDAFGRYAITTAVLTANTAILVYVDNDASYDANTVTMTPATAITGVNLYAGRVITRHDNAGALSIANMNTAKGAYTDAGDILYSVTGGNLTVSGTTTELHVPTGHTFTPGGIVTTADIKILGTLNGGTYTHVVSGNWTNSGTFTPGTSTVNFNGGSGTQTINSGGTGAGKLFNNINHTGAGILQLITNDILVSGTLTNSSGAGNFDANGRATTVTGLTTVTAGAYLASTATQTFNGGLTINGGTFTGSSGAVSVSSSIATAMTLTSGTLTAPSGTFAIYGNWAVTGGTFTPGANTVTFSGTNQSITGNITFNNFTKSVAAADTLTFAAGSTTTINGTATINGASGQLLSLVSSSSPTKWNFNLGSSATNAISYVSVKDSDATGSAAAKKPIAPTSSSDAGNTVSWFAGCPGGVVTSTADSGASTLRECIGAANSNGGGTISFNIATAANQNDGGGNSWWRISPTTALPTISVNGIIIDGTTQTTNKGNTNALGPEIEVYAGAGSLSGFTLASNNNTLKGVVIDGPFNIGVIITGNSNTVSQSYIGTNATGVTSPTVASGNKTTTGFYISGGASSNMIGGATSADRNVISGTSSNTIWLLNSTTQSNTIRNNHIGTTATGDAVIPNAGPPNGIIFTDATHDNTVRDNVISGNYNGIYLDGATADPTLNFIKGNTIGLNAAGTAPIANNTGIYIASGANNTTIGGTTAADRNIISGNAGDGIYITDAGSNTNTITGNYIGTNPAGTAPVANGARGVELANGCSTNTIGGVAAGAGNIISGNAWVGVSVFNASNTNIYGNIIGTGVAGTENLGNGSYGVDVSSGGASTNIGGLSSGQGNVIANSGGHGVFIQASAGTTNVINGNTIRNNGYQGIEILRGGVLIQANVVRNNTWSGIHDAAGASSNALIYHNTLHGNAFYGLDISNTSTGSVARNNIMTGNTQYGIYVSAGGSLTESYNDVTDASTTPANGSGRSNVALSASDLNANPLYVNSGSGNFNLTECTSPAINAGVDLAAAQPDMNGGSPGNFNGAAPDMGAYETTCGGDTISGTVYTDDTAGSNVGSGKTVRLIKNGTNVGTDITRAGGAYSITSSISAGDAILVYIDGDATYKGSAVTISNGSGLATLNIYGDHSIITRFDNGAGSLTSANMSTALGAYSDTDIEYTVPSGVLTCTAGTKLNVPSTYTFASGANTSLAGVKIAGTFIGGSYTHTVSANWNATSGTFTAGTSTVTFNGASGTQALNSGGTGAGKPFYNLTHSGAGTLQLVTNALAVTNDFTNSAGTFDTKSGSNYPVSVTRDYIQSGGQATAQSSTITVGRDFTADGTTSSTGYNSASVVLTGAGNLAYHNLATPKTNGIFNLTCGQNGNITTLNGQYEWLGVLNNLTVGSGGLTEKAEYWVTISISGTGNAFTVDATNTTMNFYTFYFVGNGVVNLPNLAKGYNTNIITNGNNTQISQTGNITLKNTPGSGGIYNAGASIYGDFVLGGVSSWITNGYDLIMWGDLNLGFGGDTGGKTLDITNSNVTIGGNVYINASTETFTTTGSTVTANGASGTQQYQTQGKPFNNLIHSGAGSLQVNTSNLSVGGTFANSAGTYDSNALTTTVTGLATVSGGTYSASTNTQTFNGGLTIDGGTFTGSSGAVSVSSSIATAMTLTSGTLTAPSGTFAIYGNWAVTGGTFTPGANTVTFAAGSGTQTVKQELSPGFYNLTHNAAGTLQVNNTATSTALTVTNDFINSAGVFDTKSGSNYPVSVTRDYIQSGGQATAQSSTITVGRDFTADGGTSSSGYNNASVVLTGAGNLSYSNLTSPESNGFYNLTCGQNGNNTNFNGLYQNIGILHNLTIGSGGITETDQSWNSISISGTGNALTVDATNSLLSIGGIQFYGNGVVNLPYLAKGYYTGISSTGDNTQISQTGNITIKNYLDAGGIYNGGVGINGPGPGGAGSWITNGYDLTMWGDLNMGFSGDTVGKTFNITNSSVTVGGSFHINSSLGTFTTTGSTVTANGASGTQTYKTQGKSFNNLIHSGAGTLQLVTNLSVGGTFTNSAGTYDSNALTTTVTGLATVSGGTYSASTNTQTFNGGLTISGGTFTGSSGTVDATDVTVSSGTLTAPSTSLNISGNLTNNGTFTAGTSTVTFDGAGISTITGSATAPNYAVTFNNLTVPAGKTVKFGNGKYIKVSNSMALNGTSGSHVTVTSDDGSNKWYINHQGTETISYVDIGYSGCDYTNSPNTTDVTMTGTNSTNNGNNEGCWVFPPTPNLPSSLTQKTSPDGVNIVESSHEADFTPDLGFSISDPDVGHTVKYEVQVAANSAFTAPIIDYTHGSLSTNPTTFSFTIGSYGSGTCAGSCPSALSDATGYWWRVRAIDNTGTSSAWKQFGVAGTMDIYADSTAMIGGPLGMSAMTVGDFTGVMLSGGATSDHATPSSFSVTDARGTGAGWNITVQATQFREYSGGAYVGSGRTLALSSLSMPQPTVAANGTSSPVPTITSGPYFIDSGSAVKIASAAVNDGKGVYDFTQGGDLTLSIPAHAFATTYRSEVTVSVVSGP